MAKELYGSLCGGELIEALPGEVETLWVHLTAERGMDDVLAVSFHWRVIDPGEGWVQFLYQDIQPSLAMESSNW